MPTLAELARIRRQMGLAPADGAILLGMGFRPPRQNAIEIDVLNLPTLAECSAVAGLDVFLLYPGNLIRYGQLRSLSDRLYRSRPRRLMLVDTDRNRTAFLKMAKK